MNKRVHLISIQVFRNQRFVTQALQLRGRKSVFRPVQSRVHKKTMSDTSILFLRGGKHGIDE